MKKIFIAILFTIFSLNAFAQSVPGAIYEVVNSKRVPLPFSQVFWIEKGTLVEADAEGRFSIDLQGAKEATLVATYIGYNKDTLNYTQVVEFIEFILSGDNTLTDAVVVGRQAGNYLSKMPPVKTEVITAAGICKLACCNLAESFENSASVTVGYSDAITGSKQIKLLGLSGIYTQMQDENRPVMRGLTSPFGLSYVPGQWLESIQIAKGPSSVLNGNEAITGQINMEYKKPTDEKPFFLNLFGSSHSQVEGNVISSLQLNPKWSTIILGHYSKKLDSHDNNKDGFRDEPLAQQINFANRWLYADPNGLQVKFGFQFVKDDREGGEMDYKKGSTDSWGSVIDNQLFNAYTKIGIPLDEEQTQSLALFLDYSDYISNSNYWIRNYTGAQQSLFANFMYQNMSSENHHYTVGLTAKRDTVKERVASVSSNTTITTITKAKFDRLESVAGVFGEYTYLNGEKLSLVTGLRAEYSSLYGFMIAPRLNFKYTFTEDLIMRLSGGRGMRTPSIIADNIGILSSNYKFNIKDNDWGVEDAWTVGGNLTGYLNIGAGENSYLSFDYFYTNFQNQVIVDQDLLQYNIFIYNLDGQAYTHTYQLDFTVDPIERFNVTATMRYTDAKVTLEGRGLVERPMTSKYKAVLNLQYALPMNKWIFDFTAQLNGPMKLLSFMESPNGTEYSPAYPMLFAQVTKKFRNFDIYIGGENLTNYTQKNAIIKADDPFNKGFNASLVWGPLSGIKVYGGIRLTIWK